MSYKYHTSSDVIAAIAGRCQLRELEERGTESIIELYFEFYRSCIYLLCATRDFNIFGRQAA